LEKSCGAVVFRKDGEVKYLLLKYGAGHWGFVKGHIELNESEKDTVKRELEEETKITNAEFVENFRQTISYFFKRDGKAIYKQVTYFLVQSQDRKIELSYEHEGYEWLSYQKAVRKLTFENSRKVLKKAHNFLKALGIV
jgi:8-oxo-dGTP pyrophosphatase MutT (NUDIX family)